MSHAYYSPSSAHRWMRCSPSLKRSADIPDEDSPEALEGTLAHVLLNQCLVEGKEPGAYFGMALVKPDPESNVPVEEQPTVINQEMVDGVQQVIDYITTKWEAMTNPQLFSEVKVYADDEVFGTADVILISLEDSTIEVIDLKYGKHVAVEVEDNEQLMSYALGAVNMVLDAEAEMSDTEPRRFETIRTTVAQPRGYHSAGPIRSHAYGHDDIMLTFANSLVMARDKEKQADPSDQEQYTPGEKQCQWCPARDECAARSAWKARSIFKPVGNGEDKTLDMLWSKPLDQLSEEDIKSILDNEASIMERIGQVKTLQLDRIMEGKPALGYKVVRSQTKTQFAHGEEETLALCKKLKLAKTKVTRTVLETVGVVKKVAEEKGVDASELFYKPEGKLTLVHESAKGRAITPAMAAFKPVEPVAPAEELDLSFLD